MDSTILKLLKAKAHKLKPVVLLGAKGLTQAVIAETDSALLAHELIKVKLNVSERSQKQQIVEALCENLNAKIIQIIGNVAVIYRKNDKKK